MLNLFSAVGGPFHAGSILTFLFLGDFFGTHRGSLSFTDNQCKCLFHFSAVW